MNDHQTGGSPSGSSGTGGGLRKVLDHWRIALVTMVVTVIGVVVTAVGVAWAIGSDIFGLTRVDGAPPQETPPIASTTPDPGPSPTPGSQSECFTQPAAQNPVACSEDHKYEALNEPGPDGCSIGSATEFLGGTAGIDVLVPEVQVETIGETCVLTVPMEAVAGTAAGVLDTDQDAAWRACTNAHAGKLVVPCSEPHTGEFVGWDLSSGSTPLERCNTAAATYLGADPGPLDDRIRVTIEPDADTPTPCLLSTTRTNLGIPVVLRNLSDWGFTVTSLD